MGDLDAVEAVGRGHVGTMAAVDAMGAESAAGVRNGLCVLRALWMASMLSMLSGGGIDAGSQWVPWELWRRGAMDALDALDAMGAMDSMVPYPWRMENGLWTLLNGRLGRHGRHRRRCRLWTP
jgi:hypothetical protein